MIKHIEVAAHLCGLNNEMLSSSRELFFIEEYGFSVKSLVARAGEEVVFAHICTDDEAEITAFNYFLTELGEVCQERYWDTRRDAPFSYLPAFPRNWSRYGFSSERRTRTKRFTDRIVREIYVTMVSDSEFEAFVLERKPFNWATLSAHSPERNGIWMAHTYRGVRATSTTAEDAQGKYGLALLEHLLLKITNRPAEEALPQIMQVMVRIGHRDGLTTLSANALLCALLHHAQRGLVLSKRHADRFRSICIATDHQITGSLPIGEGKGIWTIMREAGAL